MSSETTARNLSAEAIHDRLLSTSPEQPEIDAVCFGLETLAADPASAKHLTRIAGEFRRNTTLHLLPLAVQRILQPQALFQSDELVRNRIHTVAELRLEGVTPDEVFAAVFDRPWTWWKHGRISGWQRKAGGGLRFVLWPAWLRSPARVGIELEAPERSEQTSEAGVSWTRISSPASFFADFEGPGLYEILGGAGSSTLRSVWDGVGRLGFLRLMPATMVLDVHVRAEAGTLKFPFPAGTGFPGLLEQLGGARE